MHHSCAHSMQFKITLLISRLLCFFIFVAYLITSNVFLLFVVSCVFDRM